MDTHNAGMNVKLPCVSGRSRRRRLRAFACSSLALAILTALEAAPAKPAAATDQPELTWTNGPWADSNFFPIAVWLQDPPMAQRYRQAGFNTYVGLWLGPTEKQLAALNQAGMRVICEQNKIALQHLADTNIIGWMHSDEPDNGQSFGARFGFGSDRKSVV